jgi:voltage-gated potassium channel Kch
VSGPILVCGMGHVGYRIVQLLRRLGEPVVVLTREGRREWLEAVEKAGARVVRGDARDEGMVASAGLSEARALIAAVDDDPSNIEIALDTRRARPELPVVIRLFDQHLARHLEASFEIRRALAVSAQAAPGFAAAALGQRWIGAFAVGGADYAIGPERDGWACVPRARPEARSRRSLAEAFRTAFDPSFLPGLVRRVWRNAPLPLRSAFLLLSVLIGLSVFVFRYTMHLSLVDAFYYIITTVTTVGYGDITPKDAPTLVKLYACLLMLLGSAAVAMLYSIITDFVVTARFQEVLGRQRAPEEGHVVVAGLGNVGFRVVEELRAAGVPVVAIEREAGGEFVEAVRARVPVVIGDARMGDLLGKAGVTKASAVVAVIDDDAADLGIVLAARRLNPGVRTVARVSDADFARKIQAALQVDAALCPALMAAPAFVAAALYEGVLTAFVHANRLHVVLQRRAGLPEAGEVVLLRRAPGEAGFRPDDGRPRAGDEEVVAIFSRELRH